MNKIILIFGVLFIVITGCLIGTSLSHLEDEDVIAMDENAETVEMEQPSNTEFSEASTDAVETSEDDAMFVAVDALKSPNNEIQQYLMNKEKEFNQIESAVQKKKFEDTVRAELKTKESAFNSFREKREEEVYTRIYAVAEKIRLEKNLDAIIDARSVFSGGTDITDALIQKLNSQGSGR